jgi:hypothetical protein
MDYSALSEVAPNFCESSISKRLYGTKEKVWTKLIM